MGGVLSGKKPKENICRVCSIPIERNFKDNKWTHERICKHCASAKTIMMRWKKRSKQEILNQIDSHKRSIIALEKTIELISK